MTLTEAQIKHMVGRFLCWKLPETFNPDGGISFKAAFNEHTAHPMKFTPVGTNLLDAVQATAMVRNMVEGMPTYVSDGPGEIEIDHLRLAAFKNGTNENKAAYYLAVSKWFQDRHYRTDLYDQGSRDVLNAILALNTKVAQKLHIISGGTDESFANHEGKLPFDVVFWVTEVAEQLGIEPKPEDAP